MRRSSRQNPRDLARFGKSRASFMRSASGGRPDSVPVVVERRISDGRYLCRRDHWLGSLLVRAIPSDAEIPTPRRMDLLFEDGNSQRPFLLWRARPFTLGPGEGQEAGALPGIWHRYGLRNAGLYHSPEEHELRTVGSPAPEEERTAGHSLRADGYGLWWIDGSKVGHLDRENPGTPPTSTDLGGPVLSLWYSGGTAWALTAGGGGTNDEGYQAGLAAGTAAAEPPASFAALNAGEAACTNGTGYDPYGPPYTPREDEDPGEGSAAYRDGFAVGFALAYAERWRQLYRYNYENWGCTAPPEEEG